MNKNESRFDLRILDPKHQDMSVHMNGIIRRMSANAHRLIDQYGSENGLGTWPEMESDLRIVTANNPGMTIQVTRHGAQIDDNSRYYFKNGKMEEVSAKVIFPPFREEELR